MNKELIKKQVFKRTWWLLFTCLILLLSCEKSDETKQGGVDYGSNKPVELTSFYPDSGIYLEQVMLEGKNFGNDPEKIRVYFNNKRAAVIGSTGTRMYALAPRLPGDTCVLTVAIGNDSLAYNDTFRYFSSVTVNTIAGNGNHEDYQDGDLTQSVIQPWFMCVDGEDNIFVMTRSRGPDGSWGSSNMHVTRIDEEANELITIARDVIANAPAADPETGIISFPTETTVGSFVTLDPKEMWGVRYREMKWPPDGDRPEQGYKHSMVVNPSDGYIYTRYWHGHIVRIDPRTYEVETIFKTQQGDSFGLTFTPQKPNILYISLIGNAGVNAHSICSIDVTDPENTFQKLTGSSSGGHRDGAIEIAQFRDPAQIFSDADGNIYIADTGNHCIRRITTDLMVETVLGMPGTSGWKDGGKEDALFNRPMGIGISKDGSIYVADNGNARVRKLSIN